VPRAPHAAASEHVAAVDPVLADLAARHGPMRIAAPPPVAGRFEALAHSITHQQLAGRAATTIWGRVRATVEGPFTADAILDVDPAALSAAGLSRAKRAAIVDLALHVSDGRVRLDRMGRRDDGDVVDELVQVRGIGPWTAEMFLMFTLHRLDVWPVGDLGVRNGWARAHGLATAPTPKELEQLGERFRPHRSVVAWYCWRACEDPA
jgi:DNA-3-methyladenine glycosylase II